MPIDYPKLRPIDIFPVEMSGRRLFGLRDPMELSDQTVFIPPAGLFILQHFDGIHSIVDIQAAYMRKFGDMLLSDDIRKLVDQIDEHYFLEGDRVEARLAAIKEEFRLSPIRPANLADKTYPSDPGQLRALIDELFTGPDGPGLPEAQSSGRHLKGAIAPHIDYARGGAGYAWTYKALAEAEPAALYVVLGTAHQPISTMVAATRKGFDTPFGKIEADAEFVEAVAGRCGEDLFADELAHRTEHSIELQAVMLRHHFPPDSGVRIAAFLCGSFYPFFSSGTSPGSDERVTEFTGALREAIEAYGRPVTVLASVDLAHMGAKFGDSFPVDDSRLGWIEREDREMLVHVERMDPEGFFREVCKDGDSRRICGFASIYAMLSTIRADHCELLHYGRWHDPADTVTFASAILY